MCIYLNTVDENNPEAFVEKIGKKLTATIKPEQIENTLETDLTDIDKRGNKRS